MQFSGKKWPNNNFSRAPLELPTRGNPGSATWYTIQLQTTLFYYRIHTIGGINITLKLFRLCSEFGLLLPFCCIQSVRRRRVDIYTRLWNLYFIANTGNTWQCDQLRTFVFVLANKADFRNDFMYVSFKETSLHIYLEYSLFHSQ